MPTSIAHAALSAAAVGVLLTALHRAGPRAGGLAAAVPISSIPALFWLSLERGGAYATTAVLGTLWGTGLTVLLAASFARLAVAWPAALAGLVAWLAVGGLATVTRDLADGAGRGRRADRLRDPVRACRLAAPAGGRCEPAFRQAQRSAAVDGHGRCHVAAGVGAVPAQRSAVLRAGRRHPPGRHVRDRRELPARRCAPDARGSAAATSTAWRPRRRSSAPWAAAWALGAGAWAWPMGLAARGLRAAGPAPLAADTAASRRASPRAAAPADRHQRATCPSWRFLSTVETRDESHADPRQQCRSRGTPPFPRAPIDRRAAAGMRCGSGLAATRTSRRCPPSTPPRVSGRRSSARPSRWPRASRCCASRSTRPDSTPRLPASSAPCSRAGWRGAPGGACDPADARPRHAGRGSGGPGVPRGRPAGRRRPTIPPAAPRCTRCSISRDSTPCRPIGSRTACGSGEEATSPFGCRARHRPPSASTSTPRSRSAGA